MHNREFKFGYQHFLLCQKSFLKVSSKWLLKNKSDNGKLLLGKTYSGECFRAILALLYRTFQTILKKLTCEIRPVDQRLPMSVGQAVISLSGSNFIPNSRKLLPPTL